MFSLFRFDLTLAEPVVEFVFISSQRFAQMGLSNVLDALKPWKLNSEIMLEYDSSFVRVGGEFRSLKLN